MLRKYCMDTGKDWDEGTPLVLFAVREGVQDSAGFSPAETGIQFWKSFIKEAKQGRQLTCSNKVIIK